MQKALIKASQETETMSLTCNEFNCNLWEAAKIFCKLVPSLTQTLKLQTSLTRIGIDIGLRTNWVCADGIALI
jgi:hypothetical protein